MSAVEGCEREELEDEVERVGELFPPLLRREVLPVEEETMDEGEGEAARVEDKGVHDET